MNIIHTLTRILRGYALLSAVIGGLVTALSAAPGEVNSFSKIIDGDNGLPPSTLANGDSFGFSFATLGDLDGDGIPELAVGAPGDAGGGSNRGAIYMLFLNENGTIRTHSKIADGVGGLPAGTLENTDFFGISCAALGDLDGDGIPELAVGAKFDDTGGGNRGAVYVLFLRANGTVKTQTKIANDIGGFGSLADGDEFGISCSLLGDLDGDGIPELVVGAGGDDTGEEDRGAVYLLSLNANGTVKSQIKIDDTTTGVSIAGPGSFGTSCATLGDLDGDGTPELAVGALGDDTGGVFRGAVYVLFLNVDGAVKSQTKIAHNTGGFGLLADFDLFGNSCSSLGDLDGDGIPELAVGATGDSNGDEKGAVYVLFLNADGSVKTQSKIADNTGGFGALSNSDFFGVSSASLGDLDGDGIPELAVGASSDSTAGSDQGAVYILSLGDPPLVVDTGLDEFDTPSTNGSGALSLREAIRDAKATGEFRTITFESFLQGSNLPLTGGPLFIDEHSVAIRGGAGGLPTISASDPQRIFDIDNGGVLTLEGVRVVSSAGVGVVVSDSDSILVAKDVEFRDCDAGDDLGGAIGNLGGTVRVDRCSFIGNQAAGGGAILNAFPTGNLQILNSTFSGNVATDATFESETSGGGAIFNIASATARIRHTTFAENEASLGNGGAILVDSGTVEVENSLYAGNSAGGFGQNDNGAILLTLVQEVPLSHLSPLGNFGGKTSTRPLLAGSSAIDVGFFLPLPDTDQLGKARLVGQAPDLGAVEFVPPPAVAALPDNNALRLSLANKIKKLKKKAKNAKSKGKKAKAKKFKKKIKKLTKQLRAL